MALFGAGAFSETSFGATPSVITFLAAWTSNSNVLIGRMMKKNVSGQFIGVQMISATDGSAFTGAVTAYITKDGGVQAIGSGSPAGQCVHEGNGFHTYAPTQAETNADHIAFTFIGSGAVPSTIQVYTNFPQTGDNFVRLGAPTGASVSADIAVVKTQTAAIETDTQDIQTRLPATLVSGRIDASVGAIASGVDLTATMKASVNAEVDTALFDVGLTSTVTGRIDVAVSTRASQTSVDTLTGYVDTEVAAIKAKTDNLPASPAATSDIPSASTVASAVRSELTTELGRIDATVSSRASQSSVNTLINYVDTEVSSIKTVTDKLDTTLSAAIGSPGEFAFTADALKNTPSSTGPSAAAIADAVWDEPLADHTSAGTYGGRIVRAASSNVELQLTGSNHAAADVHEFQADVITADAFASNSIEAAALASDVGTEIATAVWDKSIASHLSAGSTGLALRDADLRGSRTVVRGTVGNATTPSTTQFTPSSITPSGAAADQFKGRIIIFDNDTATAALRGQATDVTANSNASTPLFTFTALTTAPASGDTFSIV